MTHLILAFASNPVFHELGTIFGPFVDLLRGILRAIHGVIGSWGWAIIILTVMVRLVLWPVTHRQFRSAQAMTQLQPKIKELQRKYKSDKRKLQEETMKLYQEYRVNPFASCLPLLIQMPIFICLYYAIRFTPEIRTSSFWIIPSLGKPYLPLFIFYIITQMISTELMLQPNTEPQQKWLMRAMPVVFIFILFRFPAGLMLYWVTTNLWTIMQQSIIRRSIGKRELQPLGPKPPGRFMRALSQAQERSTAGQTSGRAGTDGASAKSGARPAGKQGQGSGARPNKPGAKGTARQGGKPGAAGSGQKRPGARPAGKGGTQGGKRPPRPSGASDGPKRKPTT
ncbi:MAG TPA: membrane protein insertase YidC [Thermoleophilia bacterium]|nr:membrane protein insertase YidC [Thermoleophilia bacterium]